MLKITAAAIFVTALHTVALAQDGVWTADRANEWYAKQPWLVGANYVPRSASNQLEMWQAETFDPETIDQELGWASEAGFNCMRVFLHDLLWKQDAEGFLNRIDQYLAIADKHGIKTMFVLFDSVWDPHPHLGPQPEPIPGVHNSRWVQSPDVDILKDPARHGEVKPYVDGVLQRFKNDSRVLAWDLLNEPGNRAMPYRDKDPENKIELCTIFLEKVFAWAREAEPSQPLTSGIWDNPGKINGPLRPLDELILARSDIVTFHSYASVENTGLDVEWLRRAGRPIICTEYMARGTKSTFESMLPYFKDEGIGAINWGLVSGRSQTIYSWMSWSKPVEGEPKIWFHDVFRPDGTPYRTDEVALIGELTGIQ